MLVFRLDGRNQFMLDEVHDVWWDESGTFPNVCHKMCHNSIRGSKVWQVFTHMAKTLSQLVKETGEVSRLPLTGRWLSWCHKSTSGSAGIFLTWQTICLPGCLPFLLIKHDLWLVNKLNALNRRGAWISQNCGESMCDLSISEKLIMLSWCSQTDVTNTIWERDVDKGGEDNATISVLFHLPVIFLHVTVILHEVFEANQWDV